MNEIARAPSYGMVLRPQTYGELVQFANTAARSSMVPKDYIGKPENILIAVQMGSEIGLAPMQAIQNIAIISGRPTVWGDAKPGLCRASGRVDYIKEWSEGEGEALTWFCEAKRKDDPNPVRRSFSVADAKAAGLFNKPGPWAQYRGRMLMLRARGFTLRDAFPDVLKGLISAEEARDTPDTFAGQTIDGAAEPQTRDSINASVPMREAPEPTQTWATALGNRLLAEKNGPAWLTLLLAELPTAPTREDAEAAAALYSVRETLKSAPPRICADIEAALQAAVARFDAPTTTDASDWPGPDVPPDDAAAAALGRVA